MVSDPQSPRITRATHTVVRIRRIQNLYQRRAYEAQRESMLRERGVERLNEMQLFHGTRSRDPLLLALHRDGFMTEFASVRPYGPVRVVNGLNSVFYAAVRVFWPRVLLC